MPIGPVDPELAQAIRSVQANEQLDGTRRPKDGQRGLYEPTRRVWEGRRDARWIPYRGGVTIEEEEEKDTLVAHDDEGQAAMEEDVWIYDEERMKVIRLHQHARRAKFTPSHSRGCPIPVGLLTSQRKTYKVYGDGSRRMENSDWRAGLGKKEAGALRWWTGYTEFSLRKVITEVNLMVKRGSDEVLDKDILSEEEWEKWRVADGAEWSKVEATGAVRTMSVEESEEVSRQLHEAGLQPRILPSRMVRRWKPADQPGQPPSRKSRWCVRGDRDPDLLDLTRHAPTVTTATLSIVLQIAASFGWRTAIGDLKNAFMQSDRLVRPSGRLFCRQPSGGLPGLHSQQLMEILAGAYGLGDAPAHWRKTLKRAIFDPGLTQSVMDPTVYKWFHRGQLEGILVVEVGDLIYLISRGMKSMFSDDSARVGTYDTFYGYGTVGTVGTVRWVQWVRYGGYGTVGTVGTVQWVQWVRYGGYGLYGTVGTVGTVGPPYRTHRTHRTVPTVPTVPYHRTQRTAPFTVPSFLRTVPPHRALLLKFDKI